MFIFDRCRRSSAAATPIKYECDAKNVTGTFARSKIFAYGKINERSFSNPHPWRPQDFIDGQSVLVQVMAWRIRHQAITGADVDPVLCRPRATMSQPVRSTLT